MAASPASVSPLAAIPQADIDALAASLARLLASAYRASEQQPAAAEPPPGRPPRRRTRAA